MGKPNPNPGPPNHLESQPQKKIFDLLAQTSLPKVSCVQRGQQSHYMHQDACALREKQLMDRACAKYGQSLHSADNCLKIYQKQYMAI